MTNATILVVDEVADNRDLLIRRLKRLEPAAFDDMAAVPLSHGRAAAS